ncbi:Pentatricopeptide repeat-containing protein [Zostera marina]|uniref:Pentatricopeptide repeat-containing protein n=1 Tax=Zostera marina TaxID=29655 RepID=A0A0K9PAZ1_ZOSMR|nr:Pentatricopeptide repeat-containing protein [Zostera marina]
MGSFQAGSSPSAPHRQTSPTVGNSYTISTDPMSSVGTSLSALTPPPLRRRCRLCFTGVLLLSGAKPDKHTHPFLFRVCSKLQDVRLGNGILGHVIQLGTFSDLFVFNAVINFYAMCGEFGDARKVFDGSLVKDLVSWNSLINGYARRGRPVQGLELYEVMRKDGGGTMPDDVTMIGVVSCCSQLGDLGLGRELHRFVAENDVIRVSPILTNALIDMYIKCNSLEPARELFAAMPNKTSVSYTTMIVGYLKFSMLDAARNLFDEMPNKDIVPWNAMIAGYVQCKREKEAFSLFQEMQHSSEVCADEITMVSLLSACSQIGALDVGRWLHHHIHRRFILNVQLGTALVDMYAKCGHIKESLHVFDIMPERNTMTWTAIICGLANHGLGEEALDYFNKMIVVGLVPDGVTFIGVLSACSHAGLVDQGRKYFAQLSSKYKLKPKLKHYSCMVDLLGKAGLLDEAERLIQTMPMEPDEVVLGALFSACKAHRNMFMGERIGLRLLELDPHDSGIYVVLESMYKEANMVDKAREVRSVMQERQLEKTPGCSLIEVDGIVYEFIVRDKSHSQSKGIYTCLVHLGQQMGLGV